MNLSAALLAKVSVVVVCGVCVDADAGRGRVFPLSLIVELEDGGVVVCVSNSEGGGVVAVPEEDVTDSVGRVCGGAVEEGITLGAEEAGGGSVVVIVVIVIGATVDVVVVEGTVGVVTVAAAAEAGGSVVVIIVVVVVVGTVVGAGVGVGVTIVVTGGTVGGVTMAVVVEEDVVVEAGEGWGVGVGAGAGGVGTGAGAVGAAGAVIWEMALVMVDMMDVVGADAGTVTDAVVDGVVMVAVGAAEDEDDADVVWEGAGIVAELGWTVGADVVVIVVVVTAAGLFWASSSDLVFHVNVSFGP